MSWREFIWIVLSVLLILCFSIKLPAQFAPKTDSLKFLLEHSGDLKRIELLYELSDETQRTHIETAIRYARDALDISEQEGHDEYLAESYRKLGRLLSINGQHIEALEYLIKANKLFKEIDDPRKIALAAENLGALYRRQNDYQKSLKYYYAAYQVRQRIENQNGISNTLLNIGVIHERLNQPKKSAEFYKQALSVSKEKNDLSRIAITASQLGNLYADHADWNEGIQYMNMALSASEQLPGHHARATIILNISSIYKSNESYRLALSANREALNLADSLNNESLKIWAQKNMAEIYSGLNDFSTAQEYLLQALELQENGGTTQQITETRNLLARNNFQLENYRLAAWQAKLALSDALKIRAFQTGIESLDILTDVYRQTGKFKNAAAALEHLQSLKDSVYNREMAQQIAEMQTRFETEEKEQEIVFLREKAEQDRLFRKALLVGLLLTFLIAILVYNRQKLKINKNRIELENTRLKEKQLTTDLDYKNRALTNHTLHLVQKNETIKKLKKSLSEIKQNSNGLGKELQKLENMVDFSFNLDEDWEQFQHYFEEVHSGFFDTLKNKYPDITPNELRLAALVKLNLTIKETSTILGIAPNSVKTARYRLRKKLGMETEQNLTEFMMELEREIS